MGDLLVLRMAVAPDESQLADLNQRFADIVETGSIRRIEALAPERSDNDVVDLPRLGLRFNKRDYGRLRLLIDAVNGLVDG